MGLQNQGFIDLFLKRFKSPKPLLAWKSFMDSNFLVEYIGANIAPSEDKPEIKGLCDRNLPPMNTEVFSTSPRQRKPSMLSTRFITRASGPILSQSEGSK
jgi:hypothetical protein